MNIHVVFLVPISNVSILCVTLYFTLKCIIFQYSVIKFFFKKGKIFKCNILNSILFSKIKLFLYVKRDEKNL